MNPTADGALIGTPAKITSSSQSTGGHTEHPRHAALSVMRKSTLVLALRGSPYVTVLGNLARTSGVIKPV